MTSPHDVFSYVNVRHLEGVRDAVERLYARMRQFASETGAVFDDLTAVSAGR